MLFTYLETPGICSLIVSIAPISSVPVKLVFPQESWVFGLREFFLLVRFSASQLNAVRAPALLLITFYSHWQQTSEQANQLWVNQWKDLLKFIPWGFYASLMFKCSSDMVLGSPKWLHLDRELFFFYSGQTAQNLSSSIMLSSDSSVY